METMIVGNDAPPPPQSTHLLEFSGEGHQMRCRRCGCSAEAADDDLVCSADYPKTATAERGFGV